MALARVFCCHRVAGFKVVDGIACIECDFSIIIEFLSCRCHVSFLHCIGCFALGEINYMVMEYFAFLPTVYDELLVALCPGHLLEGLDLCLDECYHTYRCLSRVGNGIRMCFFVALLVCVLLSPRGQEQTLSKISTRLRGG